MMSIHIRAVLIFSLVAFSGIGQVEIGGEEPDKKEKKKEREQKKQPDEDENPDLNSEAYAVVNWSATSRILEPNDGLFGDTLGERANETGLNIVSYEMGFRTKIIPHLYFQGGIGILRNGESYINDQSDTTYNYSTRYTYISMPLKLLYTYGDKFKVLAGAGLTPQLFSRYRMDEEWSTSGDVRDSETTQFSSGYNTFVLSAAFHVGGQVAIGNLWSLLVLPEYRIQLNSSYEKNDSFRHKAQALGLNIGLTRKF